LPIAKEDLVRDKLVLASLIGAVLGLLAMLTSALLPTLFSGRIQGSTALPLFVLSNCGLLVCCGIIVVCRARAESSWIVPLVLVSLWGIGVGGLCMLENRSHWAFTQNRIQELEGRRIETVDSKNQPLPEHILTAQETDRQNMLVSSYRVLEGHERGFTVSLMLLSTGFAALGALGFVFFARRSKPDNNPLPSAMPS